MPEQPGSPNPHPADLAQLGWSASDRNSPQIVAQIEHIERNGGIVGLEVLSPSDIEQAVKLFNRDGFVVVGNALNEEQVEFLRNGVVDVANQIVAVDDDATGNRGSHRYSFGGSSVTRSMLHRPEWRMLVDVPTVSPILEAIFGSPDYIVRSGSGDFCLPGATEYQRLHSDMGDRVNSKATPFSSFHDPRGHLTTRDLPCPYVCVNFLPFDQTPLNGPTRQIPGSQHSRAPIPTLEEEPEWMRLSTACPAPAGAVQIRDVRAWHGGTPNLSDELRAIPNVEYYAPWFREPMVPGISYQDHKQMSERAQELTRYCVMDSSEQLPTGYVIGRTPSG